ncbi:MAG TPA: serine hydrolase domain-containing protein, partial [Myxococcota bacterium]|nr:serine hydrolase domain-containing protein [Myxococcota bacterium]
MPLEPFALEPAVRELRERSRVPGVAVGFLIDGEARFASDGVTNVDHPLPVDETTLFQIASLTKPFTATALLRLASEGKLDVEAPVRSVLPEFRLPREEWTDRVRIRDLLTHRNGWAGDRFFIRPARERTLAGLVAEFADNEQLAPPGAVYSYDNAAFCVAGRVVEVASGLPYPEALRRLVLAPLELDRTFLRADQVVTHRVAAPHVVGASGPHVLRGGGWQPGWQLQDFDLPAGGLISCTRDLLRWARFQLGDGRAPDGTALLPRESLLRMQTETHGAGCNDDAVGLAWLLRDHGGERFFGHTGQTIGYLSEILLRRERGFALVVLTNALADGGFRRDLVERVFAGTLGLDVRPPVPCVSVCMRRSASCGRRGVPSGARPSPSWKRA